MSTRFTLRLVVLVVGAFCLAVALLDPPGSERWHLLAVLAAPAVGAALLVPVVRRALSEVLVFATVTFGLFVP